MDFVSVHKQINLFGVASFACIDGTWCVCLNNSRLEVAGILITSTSYIFNFLYQRRGGCFTTSFSALFLLNSGLSNPNALGCMKLVHFEERLRTPIIMKTANWHVSIRRQAVSLCFLRNYTAPS